MCLLGVLGVCFVTADGVCHTLFSNTACFAQLAIHSLSVLIRCSPFADGSVQLDESCVLFNTPLVQLILLAPRVWSKASEALLLARTNALVQLVDPSNNDFAHLNAVQLR
jgi:hypothetical protein